jgi:phosphatidylserine decarboxylase
METLLFRESPLLFIVITVICCLLDHKHKLYIRAIYVTVICFLIFFYRSPVRTNTHPPNIIVSPCDGKVVSIQKIDAVTTHVAIFLNIFDCHIQWCPINGIVKSVVHKKGRFHPAYMLNKSNYNERTETIIYIPQINDVIKVLQIAGQLARRIVTNVRPNVYVQRGDQLGMIKLGSRVDLFIPHKHVKLLINMGDRLIGNQTIVGSYFEPRELA